MSDEGATPEELLLEASRRNNLSLLNSLLSALSTPSHIAEFLNTTTDGVGAYPLHLAASNGSYQILDTLLDQEGVEVDPVDRLEGDTPLHKAVRFVNGLGEGEWEAGCAIVELLVDAGADVRIRNKANLRPMELLDPRITVVRKILHNAEFASMGLEDAVEGKKEEEGATGSASDSE